MTDFPVYTVDDLAEFTGRPDMTFPGHVDEALSQAVFFIQMRTKVYDWPEDLNLRRAFRYAILDLANNMYQERQYDWIKANPLSSETIGSYSYSKSSAVHAALYTARPTGLMWLDLLLELLLEIEDAAAGLATHGSTHIFENDDVYLNEDGERWVLGPATRPEETHGHGGYW